jgi:hypothetical protein
VVPRDPARLYKPAEITPFERGQRWNASTLDRSDQRGTGISRNELYAGRIVWNKVRMIKDPDTGKRVSRPNPPDAWQSVEVPDLAIPPPEFLLPHRRPEAFIASRSETNNGDLAEANLIHFIGDRVISVSS